MKRISSLSRGQRTLLIVLTLLVILAIIYAAFRTNIHTVIDNKVYRSAQLSPNQIRKMVEQRHIKTIINLRGANPTMHWYKQEINISKALNLHHYNIRLNSKTLPTSQQLKQLVNLIETAPKPLLIHCESGVDRTGMASAVALIVLNNSPLKLAEQQFSWRYFVTSDKSIGKLVFAKYQHWLSQTHHTSNRTNFLKWVKAEPA